MDGIHAAQLPAFALHLGVQAGHPLGHTQHERVATLSTWLPAAQRQQNSEGGSRALQVCLESLLHADGMEYILLCAGLMTQSKSLLIQIAMPAPHFFLGSLKATQSSEYRHGQRWCLRIDVSTF